MTRPNRIPALAALLLLLASAAALVPSGSAWSTAAPDRWTSSATWANGIAVGNAVVTSGPATLSNTVQGVTWEATDHASENCPRFNGDPVYVTEHATFKAQGGVSGSYDSWRSFAPGGGPYVGPTGTWSHLGLAFTGPGGPGSYPPPGFHPRMGVDVTMTGDTALSLAHLDYSGEGAADGTYVLVYNGCDGGGYGSVDAAMPDLCQLTDSFYWSADASGFRTSDTAFQTRYSTTGASPLLKAWRCDTQAGPVFQYNVDSNGDLAKARTDA